MHGRRREANENDEESFVRPRHILSKNGPA